MASKQMRLKPLIHETEGQITTHLGDKQQYGSDITFDHPQEFCCPIGLHLMTDPVILMGDGHTYEREELQKWLQYHSTSPMTNQTLESPQFCSNFVLKGQLEKYRKKLQEDEAKKYITQLFAPCNAKLIKSSPMVKIQLIGDSNTGKTSFVKFAEFSESQPTLTTIGVDVKYLQLIQPYRFRNIVAQIRDIPGSSELYRSVMKSLYKDIHGCLLLCSCDDEKSVASLEKHWHKEVYDNAPDDVYCAVILNKYDLVDEYGVDAQKSLIYKRIEKKARTFASDNGYPFYTTSCVSGAYVHTALKELVDRIIRDAVMWRELIRPKETVVLSKKSKKKRKCCLSS